MSEFSDNLPLNNVKGEKIASGEKISTMNFGLLV